MTLVVVYRVGPRQPHRFGLLRGGPRLHRRAERRRDRGRLPVRRLVPRHRGRHRAERLRRLPLLDRLPRRLAGGAAAGGRAAAQHRQVHDRRRPRFRMRQRPVRAAAAVSTLVVSLFYLLAQMAGAGGLVALLLQIPADDKVGQGVVIAVVGALMIVYVLVGGMKGTTYVQIIKAVLLLLAAAVLTTLGARATSASTSPGCSARPPRPARQGRQVLAPGLQYLEPDRLRVARARAGARHRGPAAHPHALLHGADRDRGPPFGRVGDLADRAVLPVHARARATARPRCCRPARSRRPTRTTPHRCWRTRSAAS